MKQHFKSECDIRNRYNKICKDFHDSFVRQPLVAIFVDGKFIVTVGEVHTSFITYHHDLHAHEYEGHDDKRSLPTMKYCNTRSANGVLLI